jgi:hypothetical protein
MGVTGSRVRGSAILNKRQQSEQPRGFAAIWRIANGFAEIFHRVYFAKPTGAQTVESRA